MAVAMEADDEALKKSTDCVYFLASPLTCKKGAECEFRHSEFARINPRDCRFWFSTGCFNRECPFRHPPLDGGATHPGHLMSKAKVPCYFYAHGYCAKGEYCGFIHGTPVATNFALTGPQKVPKSSCDEQKTNGKQVSTVEADVIVPKVSSKSKETEVSDSILTGVVKARAGGASSGLRQISLSSENAEVEDVGENGGAPDGASSPASASGKWHAQPAETLDEIPQSSAEAEENWKESSPGFDVLVDDGPDQVLYYADGHFLSEHDAVLDSQGLPLSHGSRGLHSIEDFEPFEYEYLNGYEQAYASTGHFDPSVYDVYEEPLDYQHYDPYDEMLDPHSIYIDGLSQNCAHNQLEYVFGSEEFEYATMEDLQRVQVKRRRIGERSSSSGNYSRRRHAERSQGDIQRRESRNGQHAFFHQHTMAQRAGRYNHRRAHDKSVREIPRKGRSSFHDVAIESADPYGRFVSKTSGNFQAARDGSKFGLKKHDRTRMPKISFTSPMEPAVFKTPAEVQNLKETSPNVNFAGPKTLAQIQAEKGKGSKIDGIMLKAINGKTETRVNVKNCEGVLLKSGMQMASAFVSECAGMKHEGKIRLGKLLCENKATTSFEGPKPLSALLQAKREAEKGICTKVDSMRKGDSRIASVASLERTASLFGSTVAGSIDSLAKPIRSTPNLKGDDLNSCDVQKPHPESMCNHITWNKISQEETKKVSDLEITKTHSLDSSLVLEQTPVSGESAVNEGLDHSEEDMATVEDDEDDEFARTLGGLFS